MTRLSDTSRDCLQYIARTFSQGFNRGDIPFEYSKGVHGLSQKGFLKKKKDGNYDYVLTTEGWQYIRQQELA